MKLIFQFLEFSSLYLVKFRNSRKPETLVFISEEKFLVLRDREVNAFM